jgi:predicted nucleic acid-binding protein
LKSVIADTGPLYAAYDPSDRYHAQALEEVERLANQDRTVLVPYPVFFETQSLILKRLGIQIGFRFMQQISVGTDLFQPKIEDYQHAIQLIQNYPDQAITLFDATTAAIAQRLDLEIWTYDFHFNIMQATVWHIDQEER